MFSLAFYFILSYRFIAFYKKFNFMLQILINIFRSIKLKTKGFGISYHNHIFFHYYNDLNKLMQTSLVILIYWYKRHSICLIWFFNFCELFPAFICTNNMEVGLIVCLELKFLIHFLLILLHHLLVVSC